MPAIPYCISGCWSQGLDCLPKLKTALDTVHSYLESNFAFVIPLPVRDSQRTRSWLQQFGTCAWPSVWVGDAASERRIALCGLDERVSDSRSRAASAANGASAPAASTCPAPAPKYSMRVCLGLQPAVISLPVLPSPPTATAQRADSLEYLRGRRGGCFWTLTPDGLTPTHPYQRFFSSSFFTPPNDVSYGGTLLREAPGRYVPLVPSVFSTA
ncbi:hypothetical protein T492DRAFT_3233 [Pavlovales sp. CCMP2436]|nr:hypothetical protein T492DRAFT_3233 [Pavlovales sp. CCMP2436]|mmetsp:Transcript_10059/g.25296  ORF Transcript_10059/g.25296 Transcript_10059/m.25296 type:complete len:213 (+) Transcript_10059:73-711(+)